MGRGSNRPPTLGTPRTVGAAPGRPPGLTAARRSASRADRRPRTYLEPLEPSEGRTHTECPFTGPDSFIYEFLAIPGAVTALVPETGCGRRQLSRPTSRGRWTMECHASTTPGWNAAAGGALASCATFSHPSFRYNGEMISALGRTAFSGGIQTYSQLHHQHSWHRGGSEIIEEAILSSTLVLSSWTEFECSSLES